MATVSRNSAAVGMGASSNKFATAYRIAMAGSTPTFSRDGCRFSLFLAMKGRNNVDDGGAAIIGDIGGLATSVKAVAIGNRKARLKSCSVRDVSGKGCCCRVPSDGSHFMGCRVGSGGMVRYTSSPFGAGACGMHSCART